MAERLDKFEYVARGRRSMYPWDEWFDGTVWRLTSGEDFAITPKEFRSTLYSAAARLGKRVKTSVHDDSVVIQARDA